MEDHVWMRRQPFVVMFVDAIINHDYVNIFTLRKLGNYLIHGLQELHRPFELCRLDMNGPVVTLRAANRFSIQGQVGYAYLHNS